MKRKQLKIIFLSVLMVAATPRAMSNFNNYANALYHKAEADTPPTPSDVKIVQTFEAESDVADGDTNTDQDSSDNSTLYAR